MNQDFLLYTVDIFIQLSTISFEAKWNVRVCGTYMCIRRAGFLGALLFHIHNNTLKVEEWHRSSAYCERKRRVKMGRYQNKSIIYELLTRWSFGVLEWLCLSMSLARDHSFMETLQWPLAGELVWWEERRKGGWLG